jgi:PKD repeat protein
VSARHLALALVTVVALASCEPAERVEVSEAGAAGELDVIVEATPDEGSVPLEVRFAARVRGDGQEPWNQQWEFGDGERAAEADPSHVFTAAGRYLVRVAVTDGAGRRGADEVEVIVDGVE